MPREFMGLPSSGARMPSQVKGEGLCVFAIRVYMYVFYFVITIIIVIILIVIIFIFGTVCNCFSVIAPRNCFSKF